MIKTLGKFFENPGKATFQLHHHHHSIAIHQALVVFKLFSINPHVMFCTIPCPSDEIFITTALAFQVEDAINLVFIKAVSVRIEPGSG